jgi:hypothetical protein
VSGHEDIAEQAGHLIACLRDETSTMEASQHAARETLQAADGSTPQQLNTALTQLAPLIPDLIIGRAALLAVVCGALVEMGASIEPVAEPVLARFSEAVQRAIPFVEACAAEANLHEAAGDEASGHRVAENIITRFGQQVSERMPDDAQAFASLEWLSTAALAMLSRSKALRGQLKANRPLVQAIERLATVGAELSCFREMLSILDDEQVVVLHPESGRGYLIRIAGIGNNFQLHTLLADALIGDINQGWLPGERPSAEVAALAKDAPMSSSDELPTAFGAFNLWNWTGLGATGLLPEGQSTGSEHWIWNEGIPADIVPFHATRVILIGPAPYARSWNSGRFFPGMIGELEVLRHLSPEEARDWLDRLASAPKPAPAGRYITGADVNEGAI